MNSDKASEPNWYVLRSQLKRERLAAANLRRLEGVEVFLPRLRYQKTTRRGRVWWVEPLFPGYLLAKFSYLELSRAVTYTAGVSRIVTFGDDTPAVPDQFVKDLQAEVARHQTDDEEIVVNWKVEVGDEVELAEGPFKGMEGRVVEVRPGAERVSLLLEFLGESKPVEVSLYSLILANPDIPEGWKKD
ncbi:MAG: transcriptional activator RfaH [Verrucomicrobiaceae bacterium]|nr:transcriptional activator RfaH [Verrucomicrobiaceae bacterium]